MSAAGRFDDYGGTGSAFDPKLGVLWSPVTGLDFRGTYGTSFRAPLLAETDGSYDVFYAPSFLVYQDSQLPPNYTVFGTIDETGLATLDKIAQAGVEGGAGDGAPATPVNIKSVALD